MDWLLMDWLLLAIASCCGVALLWTGRTVRMRHVHNLHLNLSMERRVLESFAGVDAAPPLAAALSTEMRLIRWRKFVVIEGGKTYRSA